MSNKLGALCVAHAGMGLIAGATAGYIDAKERMRMPIWRDDIYLMPGNLIVYGAVGMVGSFFVVPFWVFLPFVIRDIEQYRKE